MTDVTFATLAKSDQLNADDLVGRTLDIKITRVNVIQTEQPVTIHYEEDNGKPFKPCKTMIRLLSFVWTNDSSKWVGKSVRLYRDPDVIYAGVKAGGIRISHMSDIANTISIPLAKNKKQKQLYTVTPLKADAQQPKAEVKPSPFKVILSNGSEKPFDTIEQWRDFIIGILPKMTDEDVKGFSGRNNALLFEYRKEHEDIVNEVLAAIPNGQPEY